MPAVPGGLYQNQGPTCFDKMKMGFMIGFCVGMASGGIFGGFTALRYGARGRELVHSVGKVMLQGGGTFGTFMAIGTGLGLAEMNTWGKTDSAEAIQVHDLPPSNILFKPAPLSSALLHVIPFDTILLISTTAVSTVLEPRRAVDLDFFVWILTISPECPCI